MNECKGIGGWLFGHKFEPAYDTTPPKGVPARGFMFFPDDQMAMVEKLTVRTFRGLYCPRCGAEKPAVTGERA